MTSTMQFRDYIFRHNPGSITVTQDSGTVLHFCPGRGEVAQQLGGRCRTIKCRGAFFGASFEDAMAQLQQFVRRSKGEVSGTLFIPGIAPFLAHLKEFVYEAAGDGRILPYTMVFVEAEAGA